MMKHIWKSAMAWLSVAAMLLTAVPFSVAAEAASLVLGEQTAVELDGVTTQEAVFTFVPEKTTYYEFYSVGDQDTFGYISNADGEELADSDDDGDDRNFKVTLMLTADETYYLTARLYNRNNSASFHVVLKEGVAAERLLINGGQPIADRLGATKTLTVTTVPEDAVAEPASWSSSDSTIVSVDEDGTALLRSPGKATLTAVFPSGAKGSVEITVAAADTIECGVAKTIGNDTYETSTLVVVPSKNGFYQIETADATAELNLHIYDSTMDRFGTIANIPNQNDIEHQFYINKEYTYYLVFFAENRDDYTAEVLLTETVAATGMEVIPSSVNDRINAEYQLDVEFFPSNGKHEAVEWSSSDETVATVNDYGELRLVGIGEATVTATSTNGLTATCQVTSADIDTIGCCDPKTVQIVQEDDRVWFRFVPEVSATYVFMADAGRDTVGYIYDATRENELAYNDDNGTTSDFSVSLDMTAGETYLLCARFYSNGTGDFPVRVVRLDENGDIVHRDAETEYDNTTHRTVCAGCGVVDEGAHTFDENGLCACGYTHTHSLSDYSYTTETHHGYCSSCETYVEVAHVFDENGDCACGFFDHTCTAETWTYTETEHNGTCTQCLLPASLPHEFDENGDCVCGYFEHDHDANDYKIGIMEHDTVCSQCQLVQLTEIAHEYVDGVCVCGKEQLVGVYVGGVKIGDGDYLDPDGNTTTQKPDGGYAFYEDGVLTLHDFTYAGDGGKVFDEYKGIYTETDLTIVLSGKNKIHCQQGDAIYTALASLTIEGDGELTVIAEEDHDGIDVDGGTLTVESGTLFIDASDHGIETEGDLLIDGGIFFIKAGDDGMDIDGDIEINGGTFDIDAEDNGIDGYCDITINGGDFYICTNDDNGIDANGGDITINGGTFEFHTNDDGIYCDYTVYLNGGSFVFNVGSTDTAIEAYEGIELGEGFDRFGVMWDEYDYAILTDENGDPVQDGNVTAEGDTAVQLKKEWISVSTDPLTVSVTDADGNDLVEGEDYTVAWSAEDLSAYGTYYALISGTGTYGGTKTVTLEIKEPVVHVGGVTLRDGDYLAVGATAVSEQAPADGGYAFFSNNTLTLNNYTYDGEGYTYNTESGFTSALCAEQDITIILLGENRLVNHGYLNDGITALKSMTIRGTGYLEVSSSYGIYCLLDLTISGGNLVINAEDTAIYAEHDLSIVGGDIVARAAAGAVASGGVLVIGETMQIALPENGTVETDDGFCVIADEEGNTADEVHLKPTFITGDVTGEGIINMLDVMTIYRAVSGTSTELTDVQKAVADYDGNGTLNMLDVMAFYATVSGR